MTQVYWGTGTFTNEKIVTLDKPLPLPPGRVRVTVEPLVEEEPNKDFRTKLNELRQALRASGYRFRTRDEIDAQIQAERECWDA